MNNNWVIRQKVQMSVYGESAPPHHAARVIAIDWRQMGMDNMRLGAVLVFMLICMMTAILLVVTRPTRIIPRQLEGQIYRGPAYAEIKAAGNFVLEEAGRAGTVRLQIG